MECYCLPHLPEDRTPLSKNASDTLKPFEPSEENLRQVLRIMLNVTLWCEYEWNCSAENDGGIDASESSRDAEDMSPTNFVFFNGTPVAYYVKSANGLLFFDEIDPVETTYYKRKHLFVGKSEGVVPSWGEISRSYTYWLSPESQNESLRHIADAPGVTITKNTVSLDGVLHIFWNPPKELILPDGIHTVGKNCFANTDIKSVTLPEGVVTVEESAFENCKYLESVHLPDSLRTLGESAFCNCRKLQHIRIPDGITLLPGKVFKNTGLQEIEFPPGLQSIGSVAFSGCPFSEITLPEGTVNIDSGAFSECEKLQRISLPDSLRSLGASVFYNCKELTSLRIPKGITVISSRTFQYSGLQTVYFPNSLKEIEESAFQKCHLTAVLLPEGLTHIHKNAFRECTELQTVTYPSTLTEVGEYAFSECTSLTAIPDYTSVTTGDFAFSQIAYGSLPGQEEYTVPETWSRIPAGAFAGWKIHRVILPEDLTEIGNSAFYGCENLSEINLPETVTCIRNGTFADCKNLHRIDLPDGLKEIETSAFSGSGLTYIRIPDGITHIRKKTFSGCRNLKKIRFPKTLKVIEESAFSGSGIQRVLLPEGTEEIRNYAFEYCSEIQVFRIPNGLQKISSSAFWGRNSATAIHTLILPDDSGLSGQFFYHQPITATHIYLSEKTGKISDLISKKTMKIFYPGPYEKWKTTDNNWGIISGIDFISGKEHSVKVTFNTAPPEELLRAEE